MGVAMVAPDAGRLSQIMGKDAAWRTTQAVLVLGGLVLLGAFVTYRPEVDGPNPSFRWSLLLALVAAALAACWQIQRAKASWRATALVALVVLPSPLLHAIRSVQAGAVVETRLESPESFRSILEPTLRGEATVAARPDQLTLRAPAGSLGYVTLRAAETPWYRIDLPRAHFWPDAVPAVEHLSVDVAVSRDNAYFVLLETRHLMVQLTSWGMLVTAAGPASQPQGQSVSFSAAEGASHAWQVRRAGGRLAITRDGGEVWSGRDAGPFGFVRLGESRTDHEHGGVMHLRRLSYRRAASP